MSFPSPSPHIATSDEQPVQRARRVHLQCRLGQLRRIHAIEEAERTRLPFRADAAAPLGEGSGDGDHLCRIQRLGERLEKAYFQLAPSARASIAADEQAAVAAWKSLDAAFHAYDSASKMSKVAAALAVFDTVAKTTPLLTRIAQDGETLFQADWPLIKPDVTLVLSTLQGKPT